MRGTLLSVLSVLACSQLAQADSLQTLLVKTLAGFASSIQHTEEIAPAVKSYGFYSGSMVNNWGYDLGLTFDLNVGYTAPYYTLMQYAVSEPQVYIWLGGESWFTLGLGIFKLNLFFNVNGFQYTPGIYTAKVDVVNYNQFCQSAGWTAKGVSLSIKSQFDVDECALGLGGLFINQPFDCTWQNYFINYPIYDISYPGLQWNGTYMAEQCYTSGQCASCV